MSPNDPYESWRRARTQVEVPDDFSDRVMESVHRLDAARRASVVRVLLARALQSRTVRVGACSIAVAACAIRIACVLATFWAVSNPTM